MADTFEFVPAMSTVSGVVYGVKDVLSGYIVQDIQVTQDANSVTIQDQEGKTALVFPLQKHWNLSCTAIGPNTAPSSGPGSTTTISGGPEGSVTYYIQSCERRATYNDTQKWAVTMEAWQGAQAVGISSGVVATSGTALGPSA
jgi:hypothetical protein